MFVATVGPRVVSLNKNAACGVQDCTNITNVGFLARDGGGLVRICRTCLRRLLGEVSDGVEGHER